MIPRDISTSGSVEYKYKVNSDYAEGSSVLNSSKGLIGVTASGELINTVIDYISLDKIDTNKEIKNVECTIPNPITIGINLGKVVVKGTIIQTITYIDNTTLVSTIPFSKVLDGCVVISGVKATSAIVTNVKYILRRTKKVYVILKANFTIKY